MRIKLTVFSFFCATSALLAQHTSNVQEPEYLGIVNALDSSGALRPLERQKFKFRTRMNLAGLIRASLIVSGAHSPIRFPADQPLEFIVKLDSVGYDPFEILHLYPLVAVKDNRQFVSMKTRVMSFSGPTVNDTLIAFNIARYGNESYRIVPINPLPPGEYAIESGTLTFCFGVDAPK